MYNSDDDWGENDSEYNIEPSGAKKEKVDPWAEQNDRKWADGEWDE